MFMSSSEALWERHHAEPGVKHLQRYWSEMGNHARLNGAPSKKGSADDTGLHSQHRP